MPETALKRIPIATALCSPLPTGGKSMRIITRGMAITLAALSLTASAVAAPVETVLYSFKGSNGNYRTAGLIADTQGAFYGTTAFGGSHIDKAAARGGVHI